MNNKKLNKEELLKDTDDLHEMSKKWKLNKIQECSSSNQETESEQEELENSKNFKSEMGEKSQTNDSMSKNSFKKDQTKRNHLPQIIDEDTEHFKMRLDHILSAFKSDATSEFMVMKKQMLQDQKNEIKNETERYLKMYEDKAQELQVTKSYLDSKTTDCVNLVARSEGLAKISGDAKNKFQLLKNLGKYFTALKLNKKNQQQKKQKNKIMDFIHKKNSLKYVFGAWNQQYQEQKKNILQEKIEQRHCEEIEELSYRFNKEIQTLQEKLQEANNQLDQINDQKSSMQENLKKAFMRGVCALNFEAMNILQPGDSKENLQQTNNQNLQNLVTSVFQENTSKNQSQFENLSKNQFIQPQVDDEFEYNTHSEQQKTIVFYNEPKCESKDHKWKNAPVVGIQKENQEFNMSALGTSLPDFVGNQKTQTQRVGGKFDNSNNTEGRVVKPAQKSVKFEDEKEKSQVYKPISKPVQTKQKSKN